MKYILYMFYLNCFKVAKKKRNKTEKQKLSYHYMYYWSETCKYFNHVNCKIDLA